MAVPLGMAGLRILGMLGKIPGNSRGLVGAARGLGQGAQRSGSLGGAFPYARRGFRGGSGQAGSTLKGTGIAAGEVLGAAFGLDLLGDLVGAESDQARDNSRAAGAMAAEQGLDALQDPLFEASLLAGLMGPSGAQGPGVMMERAPLDSLNDQTTLQAVIQKNMQDLVAAQSSPMMEAGDPHSAFGDYMARKAMGA